VTPEATILAAKLIDALNLDVPGGQLRGDRDGGILWLHSNEDDWNAGGAGDPVPQIDDPATVGVLLNRLRKLTKDPHARARWSNSGQCWEALAGYHMVGGRGPTEGEAIAAAILATVPA